MQLNIHDTFNKELAADPNKNNTRRQVVEAFYSFVKPRTPSQPEIIHTSEGMLAEIGLTTDEAASDQFTQVFSGADTLANTAPYAMCYGGHQFGHWAGQLGDGRAINLGEVLHKDKRWSLQLKGAGETPYSRTADGLAVLRSSIREHLCSEAMYHLGVPSTRSLSLALTGDQVLRDMLYDGHAAYEKGAVVCRVAPTFLRFGNFQIFAARDDRKNLAVLADYTLRHFFPHIKSKGKEAYLQFYKEVVELTLEMIIHWQRVGFVHGVMNTDNMSILGLTIDYGPYGWLEGYDPGWTPNTTDAQGKRYRFGNQPGIGLWNLVQLGNALLPLIEDVPAMEQILDRYNKSFDEKYDAMMLSKLGFTQQMESDTNLLIDLHKNLRLSETDMTLFFRNLSNVWKDQHSPENALDQIEVAFYAPGEIIGEKREKWLTWFGIYMDRLKQEGISDSKRKDQMDQVNPKYVLRNYMAQVAIDKADSGDYSLIDELYHVLKKPYDEQPEHEKWFAKRPEWARHKVGCSMLSCSS